MTNALATYTRFVNPVGTTQEFLVVNAEGSGAIIAMRQLAETHPLLPWEVRNGDILKYVEVLDGLRASDEWRINKERTFEIGSYQLESLEDGIVNAILASQIDWVAPTSDERHARVKSTAVNLSTAREAERVIIDAVAAGKRPDQDAVFARGIVADLEAAYVKARNEYTNPFNVVKTFS